jgi:hypothetical protein
MLVSMFSLLLSLSVKVDVLEGTKVSPLFVLAPLCQSLTAWVTSISTKVFALLGTNDAVNIGAGNFGGVLVVVSVPSVHAPFNSKILIVPEGPKDSPLDSQRRGGRLV